MPHVLSRKAGEDKRASAAARRMRLAERPVCRGRSILPSQVVAIHSPDAGASCGEHAAIVPAWSGRKMNIFLLRPVPFEAFSRLRTVAIKRRARCLRRQRFLHRAASPKRHPAYVPHASARFAANHLISVCGCTGLAPLVSTAASLFASDSIAGTSSGMPSACLPAGCCKPSRRRLRLRASDATRVYGGNVFCVRRQRIFTTPRPAVRRWRCPHPAPAGRSR